MADTSEPFEKEFNEGAAVSAGDHGKVLEEAATGKGDLIEAQRQDIRDTRQRAAISDAASFTSQMFGRPEGLEDLGVAAVHAAGGTLEELSRAMMRTDEKNPDAAHESNLVDKVQSKDTGDDIREIRKDPEREARRIGELAVRAGNGDQEARDELVREMRHVMSQSREYQDRVFAQLEEDGGNLSPNQDCPYVVVQRDQNGQVVRIDFERMDPRAETITLVMRREGGTPGDLRDTEADRRRIMVDIESSRPGGQ